MSAIHDTRRDRLVALQMQIAIAKRELDEVRGRPFPDECELSERHARIRQLRDAYHRVTWEGAA